MSFEHVKYVIENSDLRGPDRLILLALAFRANKDTGICWPGLNTIARDAKVNRRTVTRRLPIIEATGAISIQRSTHEAQTKGGAQAANLYKVNIAPPQGRGTTPLPLSANREMPRSILDAAKVGAASPQGRGVQSAKVGAASPQGRGRMPPESSENPKFESEGNPKGRADGPSGNQIDHKAGKKKEPTPEDIASAADALAKFGLEKAVKFVVTNKTTGRISDELNSLIKTRGEKDVLRKCAEVHVKGKAALPAWLPVQREKALTELIKKIPA